MKKYQYILSVFLFGLFFLNSCSLDTFSPDQLDTNSYWRSATDAENGLAAAYSQLDNGEDAFDYSEIKFPVEAFREDLYKMGPDANNYPNWGELYNFSYSDGNSQFTWFWQKNYLGIQYANEVLAKVQNVPMEDAQYKKQILAEARFLRAYYHMKLLLNWKNIIRRDIYIVNQNQIDKGVEDRSATWNFIIGEFNLAAADLPVKQSDDHLGRATRGAAYAYMGYCLLTQAYEEPDKKADCLKRAQTAFEQVETFGYDLVPGDQYISMFDGTNKNSVESVFERQFSDNTASGADYRTAIHKWIAVSELNGWDEIEPSDKLINEYKKEGFSPKTGRYDTRMYQTLFFNDPYFNDPVAKRVYGKTYADFFGKDSQKACFRKYLPKAWDDLQRDLCAVNVPLMRYSDVLLLLAETLNEEGSPAAAIPLINRVRERADMPDLSSSLSQQAVRTCIEHERILEFPLENTRFYDLRRWGKAKEELDAVGRNNFDPDKNNFYPIPLMEKKSNSKV